MFDSPRSFADFEPFLNSEQAAALVKVHPKTLQRLARNGRVVGTASASFGASGPPISTNSYWSR
jgi:hypothetical protein